MNNQGPAGVPTALRNVAHVNFFPPRAAKLPGPGTLKTDFLKARRCFSSTWHRTFGTIDPPSFGHLPERTAFLRRPVNWTSGRRANTVRLFSDYLLTFPAFVGTVSLPERSTDFLRLARGRRFPEEFRFSYVSPLHSWQRGSFGVPSNGLFRPGASGIVTLCCGSSVVAFA